MPEEDEIVAKVISFCPNNWNSTKTDGTAGLATSKVARGAACLSYPLQ
jgi:hypothetical protein